MHRTQRPTPRSLPWLLALAPVLLPGHTWGQGHQQIVLKDPTPRSPDLDTVFAQRHQSPVEKERIAAYNKRRYALITDASARMSTLATLLAASLAQKTPPPDAPTAEQQAQPLAGTGTHPAGQPPSPLRDQAEIAAGIETLARNIHNALSTVVLQPPKLAPTAARATPLSDAQLVDLRTRASGLVELTHDLQQEVAQGSAETVSYGILTRSAAISSASSALHDRLLAR